MQLIFITVIFIISSLVDTLEISIINSSRASLLANIGENHITKRILKLKENISSVLIVILILDTALHSLISLIALRYFETIINTNLGWTIFTVSFTACTVYFSILSKILALNYSTFTIKFFAYPFSFFFALLKPLGTIFAKIGEITFTIIGMKKTEINEVENYKKELFFTLDEGKKLSQNMEEITFMEHLLNIRDVNIEKIMTSRIDFDLMECHDDLQDMTSQLLKIKNRKRIIIYENDEDNILGTLDIQKFLAQLHKKQVHNVKSLIDPPHFFVKTTDVYRALKFFSNSRHKLMFVTDEYGSVKGIVSLTDVLSEIFGDIDQDDDYFEQNEDGIIVSGTYNIRSLNRRLNWDLPDDYITVGGFLVNLAKRIPQEGNLFPYDKYRFLILKTKKTHIDKVLIQELDTMTKTENTEPIKLRP